MPKLTIKRNVKMYLSLKAVIEAIMEKSWEEGRSLYALRNSKKLLLSDETRHIIAELLLDSAKAEATDKALDAIARADGAGRVAWLGEWVSSPDNCRRMLSYMLGRWHHNSIPVADWEGFHSQGYPEAIIAAMKATNPGRFEIHQ